MRTVTDQDNKIHIDVNTAYIDEESSPEQGHYVFSYRVTIRNDSTAPAQLINRHWVITDADGKVQVVQGEGVVGEQPYLRPGEGFQYTSGTMLSTPMGMMEGHYEMLTDDGECFQAQIPQFLLSVPRVLH